MAFINWLFKLFGAVVDFLFWDLFSGYRWKHHEVRPNPAISWQNTAIQQARRIRDLEYTVRQQAEKLEERKK